MHKLVLAVGAVLFVGVRLHVLDDDIPNPDIVGIIYSAEVILDGGLPYVDTSEIKGSGSFWLVAAVIALLGRGLLALQAVHTLWLLAAAPAVWLVASDCARAHPEPERKTTAALATAVYLTFAPMFSYNYSSWMMPPYAWAVAAAVLGFRTDRRVWHLLVGVLSVFAYVSIQRAVVLAPLLGGLWWWARRKGAPGASPRTLLWWVVGAAVGTLIVVAPYVPSGRVDAVVFGVVPLDTAARYTAVANAPVLATALGATRQLVVTFWMGVLLTAAGGWTSRVAQRSGDGLASDTWVVGGLWLAASIAGAALGGGRFYIHYLVQYVPAVAILAAHPSLGRLLHRRDKRASAVVAATVAAQLLEVGLGRGHRYEARARRLESGVTAGQAAGQHIREYSAPGEPVLCWGWTAWRVYYWSQRRAPGRVYKPMGTVTSFNGNTEFNVGGDIEVRLGPDADAFIAEFDANPPGYFVYSPSLESTFGAASDPLQRFTPLMERIARDYALEAAYGDLRLFRRRARPRT